MLDLEINLYDEMKAREVAKYEYQRKETMLDRKTKKGSTSKSLEKLKVAISHLHTRYIVETQSVVSTVEEINRVRDEQLYPKLSQIVDGLAIMWKSMLFHHESQFNIVYHLKSLDDFHVLMETSEYHYRCTNQLYGAVCDWYTQLCGLIEYQKDFIRALHSWLKLSLNPIETNSTENVYSKRIQNPPIHFLVTAWKNDLDNLPDEVAKNAIRNLASVIQTILHKKDKDLKMNEKYEGTRKELEDCEELKFDNQARETHLASLRHSLAELFRAMSEIAQACSGMYHSLRNIGEHLLSKQPRRGLS